ncbi:hypothetical protein C6558_12605 [Ensifer sp. NM-2]|nr:hypothetical protein [Ensifer sp. NM-2]PSS64366.1 hypothetical protein C6558_12605 [Ensifer sp. NM-2]
MSTPKPPNPDEQPPMPAPTWIPRPIEEPEPDELPDEKRNPNPDEVSEPPKYLSSQGSGCAATSWGSNRPEFWSRKRL